MAMLGFDPGWRPASAAPVRQAPRWDRRRCETGGCGAVSRGKRSRLRYAPARRAGGPDPGLLSFRPAGAEEWRPV